MTALHTGESSHQLDWWLCANSLIFVQMGQDERRDAEATDWEWGLGELMETGKMR
jgi:hypothetical protein